MLVTALVLLADGASSALSASRCGSVEPVRRLQQGQDPAAAEVARTSAVLDAALG